MELTKAQKSKIKFIDKLKAKFEDYPIKWGFEGLGYVIYKRTYARKLYKGYHDKSNKWLYKDEFKLKFNVDSKKLKELIKDGEVVERTEEWHETTARTLKGSIKIGTPYTKKQLERLFQYSMDLKYSFSGRFNWQADTRLANSGIMNSLINCYYFNIDSVDSIANNITKMFDLLMLGGGCGFSVEKQFISKIAPVKSSDIKVEFVKNVEDVDYTKFNKEDGKILYDANNVWNMETGDLIKKIQNIVLIVPDSREGWVRTLDEIFKIYFETPYDEMTLKIDTTLIREKGEDIEGFGGTASGDESLIEGLKILIDLFEQNRGKQLNSVQWTDVVCIIGDIVVSGNVRRTALIASSDITDIDFMNYKRYDKFIIPSYRKNVNITIVCNDINLLPKEFWETYEVKGEAIGLLNRDLMQKYGRLGNDNIINDQKYFKVIQEVKAYNKVKNSIKFKENKIEELEKERELIKKDLNVFAEDSTEYKDRDEAHNKVIDKISDLLEQIEDLYESEEQYLNDRKFYHNGLNKVLVKADPDAVATNPCHIRVSALLTPNGIRQLGDLNIGDIIWSGKQWTKIINKWSNGVKETYNWKTKSGVLRGTTPEHRIVQKGEKVMLKDAKTIDYSLRVETGMNISELDPQIVMDGLVIGDGTFRKEENKVYLCIGIDDSFYFDSEVKDLIINKNPNIKINSVKTNIKHLEKTYNRVIPDEYFYADFSTVRALLRGLFTANGSIVRDRITYKTTSFKLLNQLQMLLKSLGISSRYTVNKSRENEFNNGTYVMKESYDLNINSKESKLLFRDLIGFIQPYKNDKLNQILNKPISKFSNDTSKKSFEILEQEYHSTEEVFEITVDCEEHTYWCDGFLVSNCGEANLESGENCNLYTIAGSKCTEDELNDLLQLMHLNSKFIASNNFLYNQDLVNANLRVGGDISGVAGVISEFKDVAKRAYENLRKFDRKISKKYNLPESIKLTVQKPSGTIALLLGIDAGIHLSYSPYWFRTVRFDANDKLLPKLQALGYRIEDAIVFTKFDENGNVTDWTINPNTKVVYFACEALNKNFTEKNVSAIEQMELNKIWQSTFVDQSISQTVKFQFEDLDIIKQYLKENYNDNFKTISFMIFSNGNFAQQPYQEITREEFLEYNSKVVPLSKEVLDSVDSTKMLENFECEGGICPIK